MSSLALDENGDIVVSKNGPSLISGNLEVVQNVKTRILEQKFDCFFNINAGIDWFNLPKSNAGIKDFVQEIKLIIANTKNVSSINNIDYQFDNITGSLTVSVNFKTIFQDENLSQFLFS